MDTYLMGKCNPEGSVVLPGNKTSKKGFRDKMVYLLQQLGYCCILGLEIRHVPLF